MKFRPIGLSPTSSAADSAQETSCDRRQRDTAMGIEVLGSTLITQSGSMGERTQLTWAV